MKVTELNSPIVVMIFPGNVKTEAVRIEYTVICTFEPNGMTMVAVKVNKLKTQKQVDRIKRDLKRQYVTCGTPLTITYYRDGMDFIQPNEN